MKRTMNERTKMLFEFNDPPPEKNHVDTYKFANKETNNNSGNLPRVNSNVENITINTNITANSSILTTNLSEIEEWNRLWKTLVDQMTQVTDFPPFLIQSPEDQRKSLLILTQKICEIAQNPVDSKAYQTLLSQYNEKETLINELQEENLQLKEDIENLKNSHKEELKHFAQRIQEMESYALQIEHYTQQIDKKKEISQVLSQSIIPRITHHVQQEQISDNETEKKQQTNEKSSAPKPKPTKKGRKHKNRKQSPKRDFVEININDNDKHNSEPTPKKQEFKIEENQRFEEDYISKLIQKYTKPTDSQKTKSPTNYPGKTLFERSVSKSTETETENRSPTNTPKTNKKKAWH